MEKRIPVISTRTRVIDGVLVWALFADGHLVETSTDRSALELACAELLRSGEWTP